MSRRLIKTLIITGLFWELFKYTKLKIIKYKSSKSFKNHKLSLINIIGKIKRSIVPNKKSTYSTINIHGMTVLVAILDTKISDRNEMFFKVTPIAGYGECWYHAEEVIPISNE